MAVATGTEIYDVADFKVFPILAGGDAPGSPSPTYQTGVDVPGIAAVTLDPQYVTAVLKGDNGLVLAARAKVDSFQVQITYDELDIAVLSAMYGGSAVQKTSPDRVGYGIKIGGTLPFFGAACSVLDVATDAGVQDLHIFWYKCQLTAGQIINAGTEKFSQPTATFTAFHCKSNIPLDQFVELYADVTPITTSPTSMHYPYIS